MLAPAGGELRADAALSSSSSSSTPESQAPDQSPGPRIAQPEAGGSSITLETSVPLFYVATALNMCGYDAGLAETSPVRQKDRDELKEELTGSAPARDARDALCAFIREHELNGAERSLAQYVSLALYLSPPPLLTPTVDETELPPDAQPVVGMLPLLRTFAETAHLDALWFEHHPEYEAFVDKIHDPLTKMVLDTNVYLHLPVNADMGRRFLVLLEPMLSPTQTNARIYASDYVVVVSPTALPAASVPMELIRHTYLHFVIEPLVYARGCDGPADAAAEAGAGCAAGVYLQVGRCGAAERVPDQGSGSADDGCRHSGAGEARFDEGPARGGALSG